MDNQQIAAANQYVANGLKSGNPIIRLKDGYGSKKKDVINYVANALAKAYEEGNNPENAKNALLFMYMPDSTDDMAFKMYTQKFRSENPVKMEETLDVIKNIIIKMFSEKFDRVLKNYNTGKYSNFTNLITRIVLSLTKNEFQKPTMGFKKVVDPITGKYDYVDKKLSLDAPLNNDSDETHGSWAATSGEEASDFDVTASSSIAADSGSISNAEKKYNDIKDLFKSAFDFIKGKVSEKEWTAAYEKMINLKKPIDIANEYPELFKRNMTGDEKMDKLKSMQNVNSAIRTGVGRPSKMSNLFNQFIRANSEHKDFDITKEIGVKTSKIYEEEEGLYEINEKEFTKRLYETILKRLKNL